MLSLPQKHPVAAMLLAPQPYYSDCSCRQHVATAPHTDTASLFMLLQSCSHIYSATNWLLSSLHIKIQHISPPANECVMNR